MFLPKSDQGLFQSPQRGKALAAEGVEQKANIVRDKSKQPQASPVLKQALSHPGRLEMLDYLVRKKGVGTDEAELAEALDLSTSRVGYHLLVLRSADLIAPVSDREQGRYIAAASAGP